MKRNIYNEFIGIEDIEHWKRLKVQNFRVCINGMREARRQVMENQRNAWKYLKEIRGVLGNKYYKLLKMRWIEGKTLEEVGKEFGVTRERIRQIENNLIEYLEEIDPLPANCEYLKKL